MNRWYACVTVSKALQEANWREANRLASRLIDDLAHNANEGRESLDASYRILVRPAKRGTT
jgi:hypothetical protein